MGFLNTADTLTLVAKLTPLGKQKIITESIDVIRKFSLGDSDANYNIEYPLLTGEVPSSGGDLCVDSGVTNSVYANIGLRSKLIYDSFGALYKDVEPSSAEITTSYEYLGSTVVSGTDLTHIAINRTDTNDRFGNLLFTCGMPITETDKSYFSAITYSSGGFKDTAISGLNQDNFVIIGIKDSKYGEVIDGKTLRVDVTTSAGTYNLYGTYRGGVSTAQQQDANYTEKSSQFSVLGNNIVFLFSDSINKPNGDATKSWSTGWNTYKPFSLNGKQQFNHLTTTELSQTADTVCGMVLLDKGLVVLTNPTIVNGFNVNTDASATTVYYNSVASRISQNITCISARGEFAKSNNSTFTTGDTPRISEVGLYDISNNLLAICKLDRHLQAPGNSYMVLTVKIVI